MAAGPSQLALPCCSRLWRALLIPSSINVRPYLSSEEFARAYPTYSSSAPYPQHAHKGRPPAGAAASKRTRTEPSPGAPTGADDEDDELLRMAAASNPSGMRSRQLGGGDDDSFIEMANTEQQELLEAAALVPGSQSMATLRSVRQSSQQHTQQQQQPDDNDAAIEAALEKFMLLQSSQATGVGAAAGSVAGVADQLQQQVQGREREGAEEIIPRRVAPPPCRSVLGVTGDYMTVTSESGERVYCQLEGSRGSGLGSGRTGR